MSTISNKKAQIIEIKKTLKYLTKEIELAKVLAPRGNAKIIKSMQADFIELEKKLKLLQTQND